MSFTKTELLLDYSEWCNLARTRKDALNHEARAWLAAWDQWDLACSPMDDKDRSRFRYGHWLGYTALESALAKRDAVIREMVEALRDVEWYRLAVSDRGARWCPCCDRYENNGHLDTCNLSASLAAAAELTETQAGEGAGG